MRPRSAAASTCAKLPSRTTSGSGDASCKTIQGSSPSPTNRLEPQQAGNGFVVADAEEISGAANGQGRELGKRRSAAKLDAELGKSGDDFGVFNAHGEWGVRCRAEP